MKEITFKVEDIKEYIIINFGPTMIAEGFSYKKTTNEYHRKNGDYTYKFSILITGWNTSYSITVRLWIIQHQLERICDLIIGKSFHGLTFYPEIEMVYYSTDGRKIEKGESLSIWLAKDKDIEYLTKTLNNYYNIIAKPYFDRFKTLKAFDDFLNNAPFEYSPAYVGSYYNERYMKGLIVAKLVENPNYENLVAIYDKLIKETVSDVQPDSERNYIRVKEYLEKN